MRLPLVRTLKNIKRKITQTDPQNRDSFLKILPKQSICAEIGVNEGNFSKRILHHTKPNKLYLIDSWSTKNIRDNSKIQHNVSQEKFDNIYFT